MMGISQHKWVFIPLSSIVFIICITAPMWIGYRPANNTMLEGLEHLKITHPELTTIINDTLDSSYISVSDCEHLLELAYQGSSKKMMEI
ncbi:hypothetical protein [Pseudoalteromonas galatheae]|uniref:hypothetical protein n=1 Tax=Pseudoalteromonas galatheae TaxID=579562 RepID=UPI0030CD6B0F